MQFHVHSADATVYFECHFSPERWTRRQAGRWAAQDQQAYDQQAPPPPAAAATTDKYTALKQLGELKDQGVLTEAKFAAQKQVILSS